MRVVLSGGSGFIGSWIGNALVARGDTVLNVDNLSGGSNVIEGSEFAKLDIAKDDLSVVTQFKPDIVVCAHSCAREGSSQFQPARVTADNLMSVARLAESSIRSGTVKRWIQFSSMAVYGNQTPPFDESLQVSPCDVYGWNKAAIEGGLKALSHVFGFKLCTVRPHNCIGKFQCVRDRFRNVAAITLNRIARKEPIIVFGDGDQTRSFSAIQDSLPCFIRAIDGHADSEIVNVGGSVPITVNQLITAIKEDCGVPDHPVRYLPDRPLEVKHAFTTVRKSQDLLGYEERVGWRECIRDMALWAKTVTPTDWFEEQLPLDAPSRPEVWK